MSQSGAGLLPGILGQVKREHDTAGDPQDVSETLRRYFSGKRDAVRTCRFLDVEVTGKHGAFKAMAVDVSRSGVLLRIFDPRFADEEEMDLLMPYTARVWNHFGGGLRLDFDSREVRLSADVVRVTAYAGRGSHLILLGCRFRRDLSPEECSELGIRDSADANPELE